MFDVIKSGNLSSLIVPDDIFAPLVKLVAVVAVPVTSPVRAPLKVVAVTIPEALIFSTTDKSFSVNWTEPTASLVPSGNCVLPIPTP